MSMTLPINGSAVPYGTKGFIVVRKGGEAAVFKSGQPLSLVGAAIKPSFRRRGLEARDNLGTVTPNDPAGTLIY